LRDNKGMPGPRQKKATAHRGTAAASATPFGEERIANDTIHADTEPVSEDGVALVRRATEVLGVAHVARWMQSKIPSLGGQTPYDLIQTEDGRRQVGRVLLKIEHGVY
jgi:hypothetical protein